MTSCRYSAWLITEQRFKGSEGFSALLDLDSLLFNCTGTGNKLQAKQKSLLPFWNVSIVCLIAFFVDVLKHVFEGRKNLRSFSWIFLQFLMKLFFCMNLSSSNTKWHQIYQDWVLFCSAGCCCIFHKTRRKFFASCLKSENFYHPCYYSWLYLVLISKWWPASLTHLWSHRLSV